jgi:PPOX class probable F420-dependent enzyme
VNDGDGDGGDPACWAHLTASPRPLSATETGALLAADLVAHLATVDDGGYPHVTPIWFLWDGEAFLMSCLADRPHVRRLRADPRASISIDAEEAERDDGQRPNRQVRATGVAELADDVDGAVTRAVTAKYLSGPGAAGQADARAQRDRVVIRLVPADWVAVASV